MASTVIHLDKSRSVVDIRSSRWKGPYTHGVHATYAAPWKRRPSLGGHCLKARRLCLHSFTAAAVLIPHRYCQVMEHFRQITEARKRKHGECGKKTSAIWDVPGDRFALLLTRVLTAPATNLCSTAGDNKRAFKKTYTHTHTTEMSATRLCRIKCTLKGEEGFHRAYCLLYYRKQREQPGCLRGI